MEKHVYIVVSQTGTLLSRLLKLVTKGQSSKGCASVKI